MKPLLLIALLVCLAGCTPAAADVTVFPTSGRVDYQLGGAWQPPDDVTVVARDRTDPPLDGVYSICYINGFQTQPQEAQFWLDEHPDLLLRDAEGEPQFDPGWPDEMALDTSSTESRAALADIMDEWIRGCADDGYQAVEFDNLDSYSRFDGLTLDDNVAFAARLVDTVHELGLDAGQKNSAELGTRGRDEIGFDFVISEECFVYDECSVYKQVYADHFIDIEYQEFEPGELDGLCTDPDVPLLTIVRDRALSPGNSADGAFWSCDL